MKFNCKHTVVAKCLKLGAEMMPKHFAGMIFVHLFLAVLPVFGIQSPNLSACRKVCIVRLSGINIASSGFALWSVFVSDEKLHHLL